MKKPVGSPATKLPGDQALLPQSPQGTIPKLPHLPGAEEGSQLPPCFQLGKSNKANGTVASMPTPTTTPCCQELGSQGSLGVAEHGPCEIRGGGIRVLYPLPTLLSRALPFLLPFLAQTSRLLFPSSLSLCFPVCLIPDKVLSKRLLKGPRQPLSAPPGWSQ